ncbi:MAG: hypothetical protein OHK0039_13150 [Bacteroidia bacterium]
MPHGVPDLPRILAPLFFCLLVLAASAVQYAAGAAWFDPIRAARFLLLPGTALYYLWLRPYDLRYPLPLSVALLIYVLGTILRVGHDLPEAIYLGQFAELTGCIAVMALYTLRFVQRRRQRVHLLKWGLVMGYFGLAIYELQLTLPPLVLVLGQAGIVAALLGAHLYELFFVPPPPPDDYYDRLIDTLAEE